MYRCCALLFLSAMATFLRLVSHEFTRVHTSSCGEEVPPVPRRKSWSSGDPWPTGVDLFDSKQGQEAENDTCDTTSHEHEPHVAVAHESLKLERHRTGRCKPRVFFASRHGCADSSCGFCHLAHKSPKRRPQKQTRDFFKAAVEEAFQRQELRAVDVGDILTGPHW